VRWTLFTPPSAAGCVNAPRLFTAMPRFEQVDASLARGGGGGGGRAAGRLAALTAAASAPLLLAEGLISPSSSPRLAADH